MIIKALADAAAGMSVPPAGYQNKATPWALTLSATGAWVSLAPLTTRDGKGKSVPIRQPVPKVTRTVNVAPQLACDTGIYTLGLAKPVKGTATDSGTPLHRYDPWTPTVRDRECHEAWVAMIRRWHEDTSDEAAAAILAWITSGKEGLNGAVPTDPKAASDLATANIVIFIDGDPTPAHLRDSAVAFWQSHVSDAKTKRTGICTACGRPGPLVETFPTPLPVQLSPGSDQTTGVALTSGNFATASRDLLVTGLRNAAICLECASGSVAGLTALASDEHHRWRGDDAWTVWWLRSGSTPTIMDWLNAPPASATMSRVFDQVRAGRRAPEVGDPQDHYFALTYSGRASRIVIRSWVTGPLAEVAEAIDRYFADSAVTRPGKPERLWEPLWALAAATGKVIRHTGKASETKVPHGAHTALTRTALTGGPAPMNLLALALARSRAEIHGARSDKPDERGEYASREHARACLVRLILTRNPHLIGASVMPTADLDLTNPHPSYLCGRLFAEYESLQRAALGSELNASITDRTYSKAMTNPMLVFPSLDRLAKAHLRKLRNSNKEAAAAAIDKRITEIAARIGTLPVSLDVAEQGLWMLGYYQQRAANINAAQTRSRSTPPEQTEPT